ncbi:MAG: hypothetical protein A2Y65_03255 [Deltaproteobacteria bacterium RBG_13_52_11]|nr:MAG: hypothetical protein A2Y65_03255 [Deltaproteobacteria bacterium RBG_13_52_11]
MTQRIALSHRDFLAQEQGTIFKQWGGKTPICLVFPNTYHVGMSNLGFQLLYRILNSLPDVVCERAFLPEQREWQEYVRSSTPLLSLESNKPLSQFQIIAFSIPFENDFPHVLSILQLAKIPYKALERDPRAPLIVVGGAACTLNPEPLAPFVDLFFIGEGEEGVIDFLEAFQDACQESKEDFLEAASRIEGIYCPALYEPSYGEGGFIKEFAPLVGAAPQRVRRRWVKDPGLIPSGSAILTPLTEFKEMFLMEVNRGCPRRCRFCAVRAIYLPFRNRGIDTLIQEADLGLQRGRRIGLVGSALGDHPGFNELCAHIVGCKGEIAISSIRADAVTEERAELLAASRHRTVTMAPEAGTERLREVVAKGLRDEEIFCAVEALAAHGIRDLKLYFIIGLPTETWDDIEGIATLVKRIRHHMGKGGRSLGAITLSIAPFIPKAWTPFQWHPFENVKILKKKILAIKKGAARIPRCRVLHELPKWGYVQTLLSMGDRRVAEILLRVHEANGDWGSALKNSYINPDFWVYREKRADEVFPWAFIDHGIKKEDLWKEYKEAVG